MKKIFTPILTVSLIALMSTAAFAADNTPAPKQLSGTKAGIVQASRDQRADFKSQVAPLKAEKKANREQNLALRQQNKALLEQIENKLSELKSGENKLTPEQKEKLKALRSDVKAVREELKATEGEIKSILEANKDSMKNMDLEAVQAAFDQIYGIQSNRHDKLVQINTKLSDILALIG